MVVADRGSCAKEAATGALTQSFVVNVSTAVDMQKLAQLTKKKRQRIKENECHFDILSLEY